MLETLSYAEYISWVARYSIEPFPEERADLRNAMLMALLANVNAGKGQNFTVEQFMPDFWGSAKKQQTTQEILQNAQILNALINKKKSSDGI